jgi:hypothetical protein
VARGLRCLVVVPSAGQRGCLFDYWLTCTVFMFFFYFYFFLFLSIDTAILIRFRAQVPGLGGRGSAGPGGVRRQPLGRVWARRWGAVTTKWVLSLIILCMLFVFPAVAFRSIYIQYFDQTCNSIMCSRATATFAARSVAGLGTRPAVAVYAARGGRNTGPRRLLRRQAGRKTGVRAMAVLLCLFR